MGQFEFELARMLVVLVHLGQMPLPLLVVLDLHLELK
nr:hypothetical protein Q903MT_gene2404 [Picea sitchensis]